MRSFLVGTVNVGLRSPDRERQPRSADTRGNRAASQAYLVIHKVRLVLRVDRNKFVDARLFVQQKLDYLNHAAHSTGVGIATQPMAKPATSRAASAEMSGHRVGSISVPCIVPID